METALEMTGCRALFSMAVAAWIIRGINRKSWPLVFDELRDCAVKANVECGVRVIPLLSEQPPHGVHVHVATAGADRRGWVRVAGKVDCSGNNTSAPALDGGRGPENINWLASSDTRIDGVPAEEITRDDVVKSAY